MDKKEIMQIGDLKATGNTWKLILMRLVSGIIFYRYYFTFDIQNKIF